MIETHHGADHKDCEQCRTEKLADTIADVAKELTEPEWDEQ
jgi:hypothetical protein